MLIYNDKKYISSEWTNQELKYCEIQGKQEKKLGLLIIIAYGSEINRPKWIQTPEKLKLQTEKVSEIIYDDLFLWF